MPDEDGQPLVAGAVMLDQVDVMKGMLGDRWAAALDRLTPEERELWETFLPIQWVSSQASNRLIVACARELGRPPEDVSYEVSCIGVERTFNSIWRILLRITTDRALVKRTPLLYSKTYDSGSLRSEIPEPGRAVLWLEGWPDVPKLDLTGLRAGIETVLRCAGRKNVQVRFRRTPEGAEFTGTWDP